jgi:acyl-coenzyme A thioesterase PaaI-like protein
MMSKPNRLMKVVNATSRLPEGVRTTILSTAFGKVVPMVGTGGIRYEVVSPEQVVCTIKNRRPMQNHIKSLHAVAMALLAETATGFVVGVNLPDDKMPLIKSLKLDYKKLAKGDMKAVATLTEEQRQKILTEPKGEVLVPVVITDATGNSPVEAEMLWAWVPKKRT